MIGGLIAAYLGIGFISAMAYFAVNESHSEAKEAFVCFILWPLTWTISAWAGIRRYAGRRLRDGN